MKFTNARRGFLPHAVALSAILPLLFVPASCTSPNNSDAAMPAMATTPPARPTQPDGYPNLNMPVAVASPQVTEEERARHVEELMALRERQEDASAAAEAAPDQETFRRASRERSQRVLEAIETSE